MTYLIDTNIVTYILKNNQTIINKLDKVTELGEEVFISCITYYEIKRGLLAVNATKQLDAFAELCSEFIILFLDDIAIIERACEIHADLKINGTPIQDADVLIAATAITHDLNLVSNDSDMLRVQNLKLENWLSRGV
ncbi:MAG: type II toxin-antitoxin system VapC family toxin [Nostocaceae cyanobacterium]|nr:type II toxin-antitoxin system VapC family toxin [Nostocaceae cyanobacterium]